MTKPRRLAADYMAASAADCCMRIMLAMHEGRSLSDVYDEIYKTYNLRDDPFTRCPCSQYDYWESMAEYQRQSGYE